MNKANIQELPTMGTITLFVDTLWQASPDGMKLQFCATSWKGRRGWVGRESGVIRYAAAK